MMMTMMMLELLLMNTVHIACHYKKIGQLMQCVEQEKGKCSSSILKLTNHSKHIGFITGSIEGHKKTRCGTLKGLSAAIKRKNSGSQKLKIDFSSSLGGPIGPNYRAFVDEVVLFMRKSAPLIGVKVWKDIDQNVKKSIALDVMVRKKINFVG